MNGAVILPEENQELKHLPCSLSLEHSVNYWAAALGADLWSGTKVGCRATELNRYDWLLINLNSCMWELAVELQRVLSHPTLVGLFEGSVDSVCYYSSDEKYRYIAAINAVDCLGTLVDDAAEYHRLFTSKPVRWLGVPFPVEEVKKFRVRKEERVFISFGSALNHHNTLASLLLALKVFPFEYKILLQDFKEGEELLLKRILGPHFSRVVLHNPVSWLAYLEQYSKCFVQVNLSNRYTWGRAPLDFAGLGIPVLGTKGCETQQKLFPFTTLQDPFKDIKNAIRLLELLQADDAFYQQVIEHADKKLETYGIAAAVERFNQILESVG